MKYCYKCKEHKDLKEFSMDRHKNDGLSKLCRGCCAEKAKIYYKKNRKRLILESVKWGQNHPERRRLATTRYYENHRDRYYRWNRIRKLRSYGMSEAEYRDLLKEQKMACAICKTKAPGKKRKEFSVDHDHSTGKVRGLLCNRCNKSIGAFNDDPKLLAAALAYLISPQKRTNLKNIV